MDGACPSDDDLQQFASGSLAPLDEAQIEQHLRSCRSCRHLIALLDDDTAGQLETRRSDHAGHVGTLGMEAQERRRAAEQPERLGRFVLLRRLGSGAMGIVYAAYDEQLDRRIALKLLLHEANDRTRAMVEREAKAMARLTHPNVVHVYEVGHDEGQLYIAMEFVEGQTLAHWQAARSWEEIVEVYVSAGEGLAAAHEAGLVHRDFKPHNVMVQADGSGRPTVKVLDFGLARRFESPPSEHSPKLDDDLGPEPNSDHLRLLTRLTAEGRLVGTPAYMAPEQFESSDVTAAADQFAFCVSLWEALYGQRPFAGRSLKELRDVLREGQLPDPPSHVEAPSWLHAILVRGLHVPTEERWPSMRALLEALARDRKTTPRSWRTTGALVGALGLATIVAVRSGSAPATEPCAGAAQQLEGVWDDDARANAESAMTQTHLPYAADVWSRTAARLDDYAESWQAMHTEACRATTVRGEQSVAVMDLRMACLHRAKVSLAAVSRAFARADAQVVDRAYELVGALRPLSRCEDIAALQADVEPPPSEEAEAVEAARARLNEVSVEQLAGHYESAKSTIAEARALLTDVGYGPVKTELLIAEGSVLAETGDYDAATEAYDRAIESAVRWRQWPLIADAAASQLYVVGYLRGNFDAALRYRAFAFGASAGDPVAEATAASNLASVFYAQGKYDDAEVDFRRALALREQALEPDHPHTIGARSSLSAVHLKQGKYEEAEAEIRSVLASRQRVMGPEHPVAAATHNSLAAILHARGDYDRALVEVRRGLALRERALGPEHPDVATSRNDLGGMLMTKGQYATAEPELRAALAIRTRALDSEHPKVAASHHTLALLLHRRGRLDEAKAEFERALDIRTRVLDPSHHLIVDSRSALASVLESQGHYEEAEAEQREILALRTEAWGPEHARVAPSHQSLATVLLAQGKEAEAEAEARRGLAIHERALGSEHHLVGVARYTLARSLAAQHRYEEAESESRRAEAIQSKALGDEHPEVFKSRTARAEVLLQLDRPDEAAEVAERAWTHREHEGLTDPTVATAAFVLARALWDSGSDAARRGRARALAEQAAQVHGEAGERYASEAEQARAWLREHR